MNVVLAQIITGLGILAIVLGIAVPVLRRRRAVVPSPEPAPPATSEPPSS